MAIKMISRKTPIYSNPSNEESISGYLSKGDIIFVVKSRKDIISGWEKIESNGKLGYIKADVYEKVVLARLNIKEKKLYGSPNVNSDPLNFITEGDYFVILDTIIKSNNLWNKVRPVDEPYAGYLYISDTPFPPNNNGYDVIKNSFQCYLKFKKIGKTPLLKSKVKLSHLISLISYIGLCYVLYLLIFPLVDTLFFVLIVWLAIYLPSTVTVLASLFDWLTIRYIK